MQGYVAKIGVNLPKGWDVTDCSDGGNGVAEKLWIE